MEVLESSLWENGVLRKRGSSLFHLSSILAKINHHIPIRYPNFIPVAHYSQTLIHFWKWYNTEAKRNYAKYPDLSVIITDPKRFLKHDRSCRSRVRSKKSNRDKWLSQSFILKSLICQSSFQVTPFCSPTLRKFAQ